MQESLFRYWYLCKKACFATDICVNTRNLVSSLISVLIQGSLFRYWYFGLYKEGCFVTDICVNTRKLVSSLISVLILGSLFRYWYFSLMSSVLYIVVCPFSFGHCVVCPSIYRFWIPLWYLQMPLLQICIWRLLCLYSAIKLSKSMLFHFVQNHICSAFFIIVSVSRSYIIVLSANTPSTYF